MGRRLMTHDLSQCLVHFRGVDPSMSFFLNLEDQIQGFSSSLACESRGEEDRDPLKEGGLLADVLFQV
jgi:hypothetical protein